MALSTKRRGVGEEPLRDLQCSHNKQGVGGIGGVEEGWRAEQDNEKGGRQREGRRDKEGKSKGTRQARGEEHVDGERRRGENGERECEGTRQTGSKFSILLCCVAIRL